MASPATYAVVSLLLVGATLLASYAPAVRATRVQHCDRWRAACPAESDHSVRRVASCGTTPRPAPEHPGGIPNLPDRVAREAYSHEVSSCGFWSGGGPIPYAAFYSYAYPEPPGFADARVRPSGTFYSGDLREFILPYDVVRTSASPDDTLLEFLQTTYEAAADLAHWDRTALERAP